MSTLADKQSNANAKMKKLLNELNELSQKLEELLKERKELKEEKYWLKKQHKNPEKREEWLRRKTKRQKQLKKYHAKREEWFNASIAFKEAYRKTELSFTQSLESPVSQLAAEVKGGRIWSIPEFLVIVENTIQEAVTKELVPAISPENYTLWHTINTAIQEKRLSLVWIAERAEFFNQVESQIESYAKSWGRQVGLWDKISAENGAPNTQSKTSIYAREAMYYFVKGPKNNWIDHLFRRLDEEEQDRVKKMVIEGLSPVKSEFHLQLGIAKSVAREEKTIPGKLPLKEEINEKVVKEIREIANLRINPSTGEIYSPVKTVDV